MVEPEAPESEAEVLRRAVAMIAARLPKGWTAQLVADPEPRIDALLEIQDESGSRATLIVEAKRVAEGRDVPSMRAQVDSLAQQVPDAQGLIAARYLSGPVRAKLTAAGLSYVDATGNIRIEVSRPGLYLADRGADRDPWRGPGRPRGTLKGEPAAKIVRTIADFTGPWTMRELAKVSKASTGATYRVIEFLEREGMASRAADGRVTVSDWSQVLRRWSDDYGFVRTNQVTRWIAPRGLPALVDRLASTGESTRYAVSGTVAAADWAAYAPARLAMIYTDEPQEAASGWDLRPAEAGANVIVAQPAYGVVFERSLTNVDGVVVAAPTQVVVDLMTGPGRNPNEAEELLEWMKRNEQSWRR